MKNFERIKNMSAVELAEFIDEVSSCCSLNGNLGCEYCPMYHDDECSSATIESWLNSEVEE